VLPDAAGASGATRIFVGRFATEAPRFGRRVLGFAPLHALLAGEDCGGALLSATFAAGKGR